MPVSFLPLLAAAAATTPVQADLALLKAFRAACYNIPDFDRVSSDAEKAGWEWVPAASQPNLNLLVVKGRASVEKMQPEAKLSGSQYRMALGKRTAYLITSRYVDKDGAWSNGCRVYDFDAAGPIPKRTLVKWMKRPPTGEQPLPDGHVKRLWEPGWKPYRSVEASFVTGTDPVSQQFGLKGLVLTAQAIGGF
jgi:hypothetical protein